MVFGTNELSSYSKEFATDPSFVYDGLICFVEEARTGTEVYHQTLKYLDIFEMYVVISCPFSLSIYGRTCAPVIPRPYVR